MEANKNENAIKLIVDFHCPRYSELPTIGLYKDQVISYIEEVLKPLNILNEKMLTPTMLNNYVKQKVVSPPKNRRYTEKHLAYFIVVCLLKQVYSLTEISELIQIRTGSIEDAYDYFCVELEKSLQSVFITRDFSTENPTKMRSYESEVVRSTAMSYSNKLFIQHYLLEKKAEIEYIQKA